LENEAPKAMFLDPFKTKPPSAKAGIDATPYAYSLNFFVTYISAKNKINYRYNQAK